MTTSYFTKFIYFLWRKKAERNFVKILILIVLIFDRPTTNQNYVREQKLKFKSVGGKHGNGSRI